MQPAPFISPFTGSFRFMPLCLALVFLACFGTGSASAATRIWTGGHASSANWNLRDNWGGAAVPTHGDTVVFPSGAARAVNTNNIAGLRLHEIQFLGLGGGYNLRGASLTVSNGIALAADAVNTLSVTSITLHGSQTIHVATGGALTVNSDLALSNGNLTLSASGDMSLRGSISGNGGVTKNGAGQVTYFGEQDNTYRGLTTVNEGTLALYQRETISLVPLTIVSRIAVPGNLVVGDGTNAVLVRLNFEDQIANTATVTVAEGAELRFYGNYDAFDNLVLRGGSVTMTTGTLMLNGDITSLASASTASIGGLVLLNSDSTFAVADGPANHDLEIAARIGSSGGHGFTKNGPGTLRLLGTNIYNGATLINQGLVRVASDAPFGAANNGTTIAAGAELLIETSVETLREPLTIAGAGIGGASGAIRIGSGATIATNIVLSAPAAINTMGGGNLTIEGVISGAGPLTKIGPGTLTLGGNGANTFSGELRAEAGLLQLSKLSGSAVQGDLVVGTTNTPATARHTRSANLGGAVTVNAGSLYDLNDNNESIDALMLNGGGDVQTGTGQLTLDGNVVVNVQPGPSLAISQILGRLHVGTGERHFIVEYDNNGVGDLGGVGDVNELLIHARVAGSANIIKSGPGDLILTASNSFTGTLTVEDGEFSISDGHGLGATSGQTILTGNASLKVFGSYDYENDGEGIVVDEPLFLNTTGQANESALFSFGSNVWSGSIFLGQNSSVNVFTNHTLHLAGTINGLAGLTKVGPGTLIYSGTRSNTYIGTTRVDEGTLRLARTGGDGLAIPGALVIGDGAGIDLVEVRNGTPQIDNLAPVMIASSGWLALEQLSVEEIGSLSGSGHVHFIDAAALRTGGNDDSTTFSGVITGDGHLLKEGNGTMTLTGTNTYTGDTQIFEGTLVINGDQPDSDVHVDVNGTLQGNGEVGHLAVGGTFDPGDPGQALKVASLNFLPGGIFDLDLNAASYYVGHGSVYSSGLIDLTGAILDVSLGYAPAAGDRFYFGENTGTNATTGHFVGLPEGTVIYRDHIPLQITYQGLGGAGNDIRLTVGDLSLRLESTRVEAGNGNGLIDPDECNHIFVSIENPTGAPVTVVSAHLQSLDEQIVVTHGEGDYGTVPALGVRTNRTAFQVRSSSSFDCGKNARFKLVVDTAANGKFSIPIGFGTGQRGSPVVFHGPNTPRAIPDDGGTMLDGIFITNSFRVAKVRVSIHATHPSVGQLRFHLFGPGDETVSYGGTGVDLITYLGGTGNNLGTSCALRTTFDDDAASSVVASSAPFAGTFRPENPLSEFIGASSYGHWYLLVEDNAAGSIGVVQCWSLELFPAECAGGGGGCASCLTTTSGTLDHTSPTMDQRLWRILPPTGCGDVQPCNGAVPGDHPPYRYRTHSFTNTGPDTCVTVALSTPCDAFTNVLVGAAYLGDFNPGNLCANLIGAGDDDFIAGFNGFSFPVPAGQRFTVVVNEQNYEGPFSGCGSYSLELYGLPCPQEQPRLHIANDAGPDKVRLHWSTAYPGFDLQGKPSLGGPGIVSPTYTNVTTAPTVHGGHYSVTNSAGGSSGFFRLRKP